MTVVEYSQEKLLHNGLRFDGKHELSAHELGLRTKTGWPCLVTLTSTSDPESARDSFLLPNTVTMAEQPPTTTLGVLSGAHHFRIGSVQVTQAHTVHYHTHHISRPLGECRGILAGRNAAYTKMQTN
jgi:hypothetical protein